VGGQERYWPNGMIASMTSSLNIEQPLASGIPDTLSRLRPASEADYRKIQLEILRQRAAWAISESHAGR